MPDVTELTELDAQKVSGVARPANGETWLAVLKSREVQANPVNPVGVESPEADEIEDEVTKAEAEEIERLLTKHLSAFCGDFDCGVCKESWAKVPEDNLEKARLKAKDRKALPRSAFAIPEKAPGPGSYPVHDKPHAEAALRLLHNADPSEQKRIKAKVHRSFPDIEIDGGKAQKSPGVPEAKTPKEAGHLATGQSGLAGAMTGAPRQDHQSPAFAEGGEVRYEIPEEKKVNTHLPKPLPMDRPGEAISVAGKETFDLADEAEKGWEFKLAASKQNWVSLDDAQTPGSPAWEGMDASKLESAATGLASIMGRIEEVRSRETAEAIAGDASDWFDAFRLDCAAGHVDDALSLVASLAFRERAEAGASKEQVEKEWYHLTKTIGEVPSAGNGTEPSEEASMSTITKEELFTEIDGRISTAQKDAAKKARKQARKDQAKLERKLVSAVKNANNGGDVTAEHMAGQVHGQHAANDVNAVPNGGHVDSEYVGKGKAKKGKGKGSIRKEVAATRALVEQIAKSARPGGPSLTGQPGGAGMTPATEGRQSDSVLKALAASGDVGRLEKEFADSTGNTNLRAIKGEELTLARLRAGHEAGVI